MIRHFFTTTSVLLLTGAQRAYAQAGLISNEVDNCNFISGRLTAECVPSLISYVIAFIFSLIGLFVAIQIVISGYQIALAKATGRDRSEGLTRLRVALIGFVLCAFSWYIIDFIVSSLAGI